jgi:hypothetical protein
MLDRFFDWSDAQYKIFWRSHYQVSALKLQAISFLSDLQEIIKPKNDAAGVARRIIFGFYMDHFFLGVP